MTRKIKQIEKSLRKTPKKWLVTGCAGFIGSNLTEYLLRLDQAVVGIDNLSTGHLENLYEIEQSVSPEQWKRFDFTRADIRDVSACREAVRGINHVLHQAALGSVPRSLKDPGLSNEVNVSGFLNILIAARDEKVDSFTYAASSSTYGDHPALPKREENIGRPLSPYAVTKYVNELYADVFAKSYGFNSIGLRYFNVFGRRQDPEGAYAAVIPKWISSMIRNETVTINGDGETSRDFCYIDNVIEANILASHASQEAKNQVYNIALGDKTTLKKLFFLLKDLLASQGLLYDQLPHHEDFRKGDVMHSQASIEKASNLLGYDPIYHIDDGLKLALDWYLRKFS